jgi:hypothetical protein
MPRYPRSPQSLQSPRSVVLTSQSSCFFFEGPLAAGLKESSLGLGCLDACVHDYEQNSHCLMFLHGDLLHGLDVADSVTEGIDDLDILDVRDSIPSIAKMFHIVLEALIMLLPDGLESLSSRWTLVCALEVPNEHDT